MQHLIQKQKKDKAEEGIRMTAYPHPQVPGCHKAALQSIHHAEKACVTAAGGTHSLTMHPFTTARNWKGSKN